MLAQLFAIAGADKGRTFTLKEGQTLVIGRGQESETELKDPHASRKHCLLSVENGAFIVVDQESASGTFVNGKQVKRHVLQPGDVLRVGGTELRLQLEGRHDESTLLGPPANPKPKPAVTPLKDLVGQSLAHFEIKQVIATGNSGLVFMAHDTKLDRPTALKVLWPETSQQEDERQRFVRAMKTMLPVHHENIIEIYAAGKNGPYCWVAMEYVDGESLTEVIRRIGTAGMLDWRNAFRIAVHVGRALDEAYKHQIIHRNITPRNILLRKSDKVAKLGDLMLAKALEGNLSQPVTQLGQLVGDLAYMPPERTRTGAEVDCRADIYSLGATVYALLTGHPPFEGDSIPEVITKIRQAEPIRPKEFQLSIADRFQDCVLQMLAKRPEDRFQKPADLLKELNRIALFDNIQV